MLLSLSGLQRCEPCPTKGGRRQGVNNVAGMTSRERVITALEHREPDRVPFDCTFSYGGYLRLKEYLGLTVKKEPYPGSSWLSISTPMELMEELQIDLCYIGLNAAKDAPVFEYGVDTFTDEWGVKYRKIEHHSGVYYDFANRVLGEATIKDLDDYPWPDPYDPSLVEGLEEKCRKLYENTSFALVGKFANSVFEQAFYMRGFEQMLIDVMINPDFANALMDRLVDIAIARTEVGFKACGPYIQILRLAGDDMGHQGGPLVSPKSFRSVIKPHFARLYAASKEMIRQYNPNIKLMAHTDGDVYPLLPDYVEMGLDVLNPVQPYVSEMEHDKLKKEFGNQLSFHGGIDIQDVMPFGTPETVTNEAIKTMRALGPGGGYILAPTHYLQPDVPPENILSLRDAVLQHGQYPLT
jgi:uroporphyrinogen decarboxylase